jgi:predicted hydrocarbon binding protein
MPETLSLSDHRLVAIPRTALHALRAALVQGDVPEGADALRDAGYAAGEELYSSFSEWLRARGLAEPADLDDATFAREASAYFTEAGWGSLSFGQQDENIATCDSSDWSEADPTAALDSPGCHLTTGLLAGFLGRLAGEPLAILEVECRSAGDERCRFLVGSAEVMEHLWKEIESGKRYDEVRIQG